MLQLHKSSAGGPPRLVDRSGARARPHGAGMAPSSPARVGTNGGVRGRRGGGGAGGRTVPTGSCRFRREEEEGAEAIAHTRLGFALAVAACRAGCTRLPRRSRKKPSDVAIRTGPPSCRWAGRPPNKKRSWAGVRGLEEMEMGRLA
jgi:hypothetical protein